ncbi:hypothetical protein D3C87_1247440 [compost metagenome]
MIAPIRIAGLEQQRFFPSQPEGCLQLKAHAHMGIGDPVKTCAQFAGLADVGHIASLGHAKLRVVRWQDAGLADLLGPPAQV